MNNIRQVNRVIYALRKAYGYRVNILTDISLTQNVKTGVIDRDERSIVIKAIVATAKEIRDFSYDLSFIAANKNFTYGGLYDENQRVMIIRKKDIPTDYTPSLNDRCIYDSANWEFKDIEKTAEGIGWLIGLQSLTSQKPMDVITESVSQTFTPSQGVTDG